MQATATSGVPHFTGGEAATIARRFHPTLMRTSLSQVIGAVGSAAEGVVAHTSISVDLPSPRMLSFSAGYLRRYGMKPDHNAAKGYFAVQVIKVGLLKLGQVDAAAFMTLVKKTRLDGRANPDLMTSASYDLFGDLNRESYFVQVRGGRTEIMATMSSLDTAFIELSNGRSMALNSNELRRELAAALARPKVVEPLAKRVAPR